MVKLAIYFSLFFYVQAPDEKKRAMNNSGEDAKYIHGRVQASRQLLHEFDLEPGFK